MMTKSFSSPILQLSIANHVVIIIFSITIRTVIKSFHFGFWSSNQQSIDFHH